MTESQRPKERLQKYKDYLEALKYAHRNDSADSDMSGTNVNTLSSNSVPQKSDDTSIGDFKKAFTDLVATSKEKKDAGELSSNKSKGVLLRMRSRALDSAIKEIRHKKMLLEHKLERNAISRDQYEVELAELISEGKNLVREKEEVTRQLKAGS